jgi:hypothetical protein
MNRVSGSNFLYKLTQAQKQIFPENATFAISAVTHTKSTKPPGFGYHPPLSPSKSVPQPPMPYNKHKAMAGMHHQSSIPDKLTPYGDDTDGPPPIPLQNFDTAAAARENQLNIAQRKSSTGSGVVVREKPRDSASRGIREAKSRRRHSSINQSSEFEKEQEKERERLEHINVGGAMYAVVKKQSSTTNGPPELPEKEIRRIRPKTPSPSSQRRGYVQLQFQNGTSSLTPISPPKREIIPPDSRTKWSYSTVVFEAQRGQKEKEFESDFGAKKKNKPLPPTPSSFKSSMSDSNILAPQPAPRSQKKLQPLDVAKPNDQQRSYAAIDFSAQSPVQNGGNVPGAGRAKKEKPKLPPKDDSPKLPPKVDNMDKPKLPPKEDSTEKPKLPLKEENPSQSLPLSRPAPAPRRVVSPTSEAPPPIPARRPRLPPL